MFEAIDNRVIKQETNNFRTVCQCCGRIIKGNENKYYISFRLYRVKKPFGISDYEKTYSLCKSCRRSLELFIKKGGVIR